MNNPKIIDLILRNQPGLLLRWPLAQLAVHFVNNILQFCGFLIFCLSVAASSPSFCSHARTASPSSPLCASSTFWIPISNAVSLFHLYLRRNEHSSGLALLSFPHFYNFHFFFFFFYFSCIFHIFPYPGFTLSPLPQLTRRHENFPKGNY